MSAGIVATACAGLFSGAAIYVSLVEHPARMACGPAVARMQFGPSYRRGAVMQASLALAGASGALVAWLAGAGGGWLLGGALLGAVVPYTLLVILPTNRALLAPQEEPGSEEAGPLLARWGRLHAARSVLGLAAFLVFLRQLTDFTPS